MSVNPADFDRPLADALLIIDDDETAKGLAVYFGLAAKLNQIPGKGGRFAIYIYEQHPTHWVCCGRWVEQREGNGWAAWFLPKSEAKTVGDAERQIMEQVENS